MTDRRNPQPRRQPGNRRIADRRRSRRRPVEAGIRFLRAGAVVHEVLPGQLLDVSPSGVRLLLEGRLETAERLLIEVRDEEDRCYNLTAQVAWTEDDGDGWSEVGCELRVPLTRGQRVLLESIATR